MNDCNLRMSDVTNILLSSDIRPVAVSLDTKEWHECKESRVNWVAISYAQQKEINVLQLRGECGVVLDMQTNVASVLLKAGNAASEQIFGEKGNIVDALWWDDLPGKLYSTANDTWPALAFLQYVTQPVLAILPSLQGNIHEITSGILVACRTWPFAERECGKRCKGLYVADIQIVEAACAASKLSLYISSLSNVNGIDISAKLLQHLSSYGGYVSDVYLAVTPTSSTVRLATQYWTPAHDRVLSHASDIIYKLWCIIEVISQPIILYTNNTNMYTQFNIGLRWLLAGHDTVHKAASVFNTIINTRTHDAPTIDYVHQSAIRSLSGLLLKGIPAKSKNYCPGDKVVAALVCNNLVHSATMAATWKKNLERTRKPNPFRPLVENREIFLHLSTAVTCSSASSVMYDVVANSNKNIWPEHIRSKYTTNIKCRLWPGMLYGSYGNDGFAQACAILGLNLEESINLCTVLQIETLRKVVSVGTVLYDNLQNTKSETVLVWIDPPCGLLNSTLCGVSMRQLNTREVCAYGTVTFPYTARVPKIDEDDLVYRITKRMYNSSFRLVSILTGTITLHRRSNFQTQDYVDFLISSVNKGTLEINIP